MTRGAAETQSLVTHVLSSCPELPLPEGLADRISARIDREDARRRKPAAVPARNQRRRSRPTGSDARNAAKV